MRLPDLPYHLPDVKAALAGAATFVVGLHLPQPTWGRALLLRILPFVSPKGATLPMTDINTAFQQGRDAATHMLQLAGYAFELVEQVMPGATPAEKHAKLVDVLAGKLAEAEHLLKLPEGLVAFTTSHEHIDWLVSQIEAFATVPAAPAPVEPPAAIAPAPEAPAAQEGPAAGEAPAPAAPVEGV